ncbi:MAG: helix-turn-helix transcriptional regulator [Alphaproteobacteria bacterium]|nr:helix-turn-helix transcriptional regulator [Alphaproteobacteria bacterium]
MMTKTIANVPNITADRIAGRATNYAAGTHIPPHSHAGHQIVHAISGVMRVFAQDASWVLPPGRGLWVPATVRHEIRCLDRVEMRTVYLDGSFRFDRPQVQVIGISPLMREILVRLAEGCDPQQLPHLRALVLAEISTLAVEPFRLPMPRDERIQRLVTHLRDCPADAATLSEWAVRLGLSQRSLIRRIRAETGLSFRELRRQARINAALELLALGQPVTGVALDVGFESPSAFAHAFRVVTGSTPRQYRP